MNQVLAELDGFDPTIGIVFLAATNRPEILDPALLRAGRFDSQVLVDRPDGAGRAKILAVHAGKVLLAEDVEIEKVAALTPGFTGADLANLVNEAAHGRARRILEANQALLLERAGQLLARETLADDELLAILKRVVTPPSLEPTVAAVRPVMNA